MGTIKVVKNNQDSLYDVIVQKDMVRALKRKELLDEQIVKIIEENDSLSLRLSGIDSAISSSESDIDSIVEAVKGLNLPPEEENKLIISSTANEVINLNNLIDESDRISITISFNNQSITVKQSESKAIDIQNKKVDKRSLWCVDFSDEFKKNDLLPSVEIARESEIIFISPQTYEVTQKDLDNIQAVLEIKLSITNETTNEIVKIIDEIAINNVRIKAQQIVLAESSVENYQFQLSVLQNLLSESFKLIEIKKQLNLDLKLFTDSLNKSLAIKTRLLAVGVGNVDAPIASKKLQPSISNNPAGTFWNKALLPGFQKWLPTYRTAIITTNIIDDKCTIIIDDAFSSQRNDNNNDRFDINQQSEYKGVEIKYGNCNGLVFEKNDSVVVFFEERSDKEQESPGIIFVPTIIGFTDNPIPCIPDFITSIYYYNGTDNPTEERVSVVFDGAKFSSRKNEKPLVAGAIDWVGRDGRVLSIDGPHNRGMGYGSQLNFKLPFPTPIDGFSDKMPVDLNGNGLTDAYMLTLINWGRDIYESGKLLESVPTLAKIIGCAYYKKTESILVVTTTVNPSNHRPNHHQDQLWEHTDSQWSHVADIDYPLINERVILYRGIPYFFNRDGDKLIISYDYFDNGDYGNTASVKKSHSSRAFRAFLVYNIDRDEQDVFSITKVSESSTRQSGEITGFDISKDWFIDESDNEVINTLNILITEVQPQGDIFLGGQTTSGSTYTLSSTQEISSTGQWYQGDYSASYSLDSANGDYPIIESRTLSHNSKYIIEFRIDHVDLRYDRVFYYKADVDLHDNGAVTFSTTIEDVITAIASGGSNDSIIKKTHNVLDGAVDNEYHINIINSSLPYNLDDGNNIGDSHPGITSHFNTIAGSFFELSNNWILNTPESGRVLATQIKNGAVFFYNGTLNHDGTTTGAYSFIDGVITDNGIPILYSKYPDSLDYDDNDLNALGFKIYQRPSFEQKVTWTVGFCRIK